MNMHNVISSIGNRDSDAASRFGDTTVMRQMWGEVLQRALDDAFGAVVGSTSGHTAEAERKRARDWIGTRDFREVCELAGIEPEAVLAAIQTGALQQRVKARADRLRHGRPAA